LRGALGIAPDEKDAAAAWMQIGMSSTIDPATYQRPNVTLIMTVDVSGSMGWSYGEDAQYPSPGQLARKLLHQLNAKLTENDRIAIVTYGSTASVKMGLTSGGDHATVDGVIDSLHTDGSTNMEAGLQVAYELADEAAKDAGEVRLVLFTDEQPNVGATQPSQFEQMVAAGAEKKIGLTVFGLGPGLGQAQMVAMSHLRGGNAFSFSKSAEIDVFMQDQWPWFASAIANELEVNLTPDAATKIAAGYGFPTTDGSPTASLKVSSVFLSKRRGAMLVKLQRDDLSTFAVNGTLDYLPAVGDPVHDALTLNYTGEAKDARGQYFAQPSVAKTVALTLLVTSMRDAAEKYTSDHSAAVGVMQKASDRFALDIAGLGDASLDEEAAFAKALLQLMKENKPQGDLYPN
jgi:Ca-activated chloride channel family protein